MQEKKVADVQIEKPEPTKTGERSQKAMFWGDVSETLMRPVVGHYHDVA